jgi:hypothetical protein
MGICIGRLCRAAGGNAVAVNSHASALVHGYANASGYRVAAGYRDTPAIVPTNADF